MIAIFELMIGEVIPVEMRWITIIIAISFAAALLTTILELLFIWKR